MSTYLASNHSDNAAEPVPNNGRDIGASNSVDHGLGQGQISNPLFEQSDHAQYDAFDNSNNIHAGPQRLTHSYGKYFL